MPCIKFAKLDNQFKDPFYNSKTNNIGSKQATSNNNNNNNNNTVTYLVKTEIGIQGEENASLFCLIFYPFAAQSV
jgi:hypothetical protein